jgi:hypothetical protein
MEETDKSIEIDLSDKIFQLLTNIYSKLNSMSNKDIRKYTENANANDKKVYYNKLINKLRDLYTFNNETRNKLIDKILYLLVISKTVDMKTDLWGNPDKTTNLTHHDTGIRTQLAVSDKVFPMMLTSFTIRKVGEVYKGVNQRRFAEYLQDFAIENGILTENQRIDFDKKKGGSDLRRKTRRNKKSNKSRRIKRKGRRKSRKH